MGKKNQDRATATNAKSASLESHDSQSKRPMATPAQSIAIDHFCKALPKVGGKIDADTFVAARMQEINSMQSAIKETSAALKLPSFTSQPRFLRRRAASHLLHHLRARDRARLSVKLANGRVIPASYRKIKSKMLMDELVSRKNKVKWLSTHKWHIKRMKMENWWGYRLAAHPMYKSRRIIYRSFTKIALLHDASYQGCLQLGGARDRIIEILNKFTDPLLPSVGSVRFTKGNRVGHSYVYANGGYPAHLIAPITFLWRPSSTPDDSILWLWIHPSSFDIIQRQLIEEASSTKVLGQQVEIQDLRNDLARFELTGPRSLSLLQAILNPVEESDTDHLTNSTINCQMWRGLQQLRSGCCIPNGTVIGLTVQDPRLRFPQKARPATAHPDLATTDCSSQDMLFKARHWPAEASESEIWGKSIRNHCQSTKATESRLLKRREQMPMPGSTLPFIPSEDSRIPILLIQRNGPLADQSAPTRLSEARTEQIDGWTLIVPWAFGSAFWRSLVYAGARTGGLDAIHNVYFDCGYSCFPYDYPTTPAFENYQEITGAAAQAKWERRPPSKRLNYTKLGFVSPHHIPFAHLLQATPTSSSMEYTYDQQTTTGGVLLQGNTLVSLLLDGSGGKTSIETALRTTMADAATARGMTFGAAPQHLLLESMAVKIKLSSEHGGTLKSRARIYLLQDDRFAQEYAACRNKRQVKRLDTVKPPTDADLIGFVTTGGYSLVTGQGQGIGACSALGLHLLEEMDTRQKRSLKRLVLVNNMISRDYTLATLSVL